MVTDLIGHIAILPTTISCFQIILKIFLDTLYFTGTHTCNSHAKMAMKLKSSRCSTQYICYVQ